MFGGYLTFVDSDDYLSPEAFCCWMKHSYADLVVGGYLSFGFRTDKSETYLENLFAVDEQIGKCLTDKIMNLSFRTPWGKLFRAEIVINLKSATYRVSWEFTCKTTKILLLYIFLGHNRNVVNTKFPYPIKRLEVIRRFNKKSIAFNQSLS